MAAKPIEKPKRPSIFINCELDELMAIRTAAEMEGFRSVSAWARAVLLREARKIERQK